MRPNARDLERIAREAGDVLMRHLGALERVEKKGARDLVTAADRESEDLVVRLIRESWPQDAILAEESLSTVREADRTWIVDPLDGTTNYVYGIPHFAVSIAYLEDGRPEVACVFNPALGECFTAERGQGASLDGASLRCRQEAELSEALLVTGFAYRREELQDSNIQHFVDFAYRARGLRRLGSAACDLCYVARGWYDGFWELNLAPWDVAAGGLVAREAGAAVTDFGGGENWLHGGQIVAANPRLAGRIREVLAAADPDRLAGPRYRPPGHG